jgi:hypothetical protein
MKARRFRNPSLKNSIKRKELVVLEEAEDEGRERLDIEISKNHEFNFDESNPTIDLTKQLIKKQHPPQPYPPIQKRRELTNSYSNYSPPSTVVTLKEQKKERKMEINPYPPPLKSKALNHNSTHQLLLLLLFLFIPPQFSNPPSIYDPSRPLTVDED